MRHQESNAHDIECGALQRGPVQTDSKNGDGQNAFLDQN
jgi:hypothetical protein